MVSLLKEKRRRTIRPIYPRPVLQITINDILNTICLTQGVSRLDVRSRCRGAELVKTRAIFSYIAKKRGLSSTDIGRAINRDHSSISHHYKKYAELLDEGKPWYDSDLGEEIKNITTLING